MTAYQEHSHPSQYSSNVMSRRNKTSQRNRIHNKLIYRRNYADKNVQNRAPIDINDRFFYQRPASNAPTEHIQSDPLFQGQGSQMKKPSYSSKEPTIEKPQLKHEFYGRQNFTEVNATKFFNNPVSPKQVVQQIYQQPLRRPHHRVTTKTNRRIMALYPSPYQSKNAKLKSLRQPASKEKKSLVEVYSPAKSKVSPFSTEPLNFIQNLPDTRGASLKTGKGERYAHRGDHQRKHKKAPEGPKGAQNQNPMSKQSEVSVAASPESIKKVEGSINKIQGMLLHMDDILARFSSIRRSPELLSVLAEGDAGGAEDQGCHSPLMEHSGRESELVTLLNCEDFSDTE